MPDDQGRTIPADWPRAVSGDLAWRATYHPSSWADRHGLGWGGYGWTVAGAPDPPFPFIDPDGPFPVEQYGPPGTVWLFTLGDLFQQWTNVPGFLGKIALNRALKILKQRTGGGYIDGWRTPGSPEQERAMPPVQRFLQTSIIGAIGTDEQFVHVLKWRHATQENPDMDMAAVKAFGDVVRDKWHDFMTSAIGGNAAGVSNFMASTASYKEVRTAFIEQNGGGAKPNWLIPSQVSAFSPNIGGHVGSVANLPYEVTAALSLNTNFRGPRFRGRIYLFPMTVQQMSDLGNFEPTWIQQTAAKFGTAFLDAVHGQTDQRLHIVSLKYATSAAVTGVRYGIVPDSQRRRRRSRPENYQQAWGTPVGAL